MISLTTLGSAYTQNFDSLALTGTSSILPEGWVLLESGNNANALYTAGTGSGNGGDTYSFGAASSTERALGGLQSGSLVPTFGVAFTNNTDGTITALDIAYRGEQWRLGTSGRVVPDRIDFQGSTDATALNNGQWHDLDALDFTSPLVTGTLGAQNGNALSTALSTRIEGLNIAPGQTFWLRWSSFDASGADDGLAIDDFSLTPIGVGNGGPPSVNLSVSTSQASEAGATVVTVTATANRAVVGEQGVDLGVSGAGIEATDYLLSANRITIADGQTSGSVSFTVVDDAQMEALETALLTISNPSEGLSLGGTVSQGVSITDNDAAPTRIHQIQAAAHLSPLNGQAVHNVQGIVTAKTSSGFYLQDPQSDDDAATSEGVYVYTGSASPLLATVSVGQALKVSGTVSEFRPNNDSDSLTITEIVNNAAVLPLSLAPWAEGAALSVAPMVLGVERSAPTQHINADNAGNVESSGDFNPGRDGIDFWESLEGMLVSVPNPVAISPTFVTGSAEELWVLPNGGAGATGRTERGGLVVSQSDANPERLQLDDLDNASTQIPLVNVGATLGDVVGVLDYSGSNYELRISQAPTVLSNPLQAETTTLTQTTDRLRVATFNVENLGGNASADKFVALAQAIVNNLHAPDILSLEEVQDNNGATNNGVVDASVTLQRLVDAIAAAGGPAYQWRQIDPENGMDGGQSGGNIRNVYLFDPARVSYVENSLTRVIDTDLGDGDAFRNSRKPLVASFEFNGETVTLVSNHFYAKISDQPIYGPTQPPGLFSEARRMPQAELVKEFVQELYTANPNAKVLVLGDLNDFEFSNPISALEAAPLVSLIETLPADQRYSYLYQGNSQTIDHMLASPALVPALDGYDVVHINAEFAVRVSDHDPIVASFLIEREGQAINGTRSRDTLVGTSGTDRITGGSGRDTLTGGGAADTFVYTSVLDATDVITDFTPHSDRLDISALLTSVGYLGSTPVADGYLSVRVDGGRSIAYFDADGAAGIGVARPLVELTGVVVADADLLLDPGL